MIISMQIIATWISLQGRTCGPAVGSAISRWPLAPWHLLHQCRSLRSYPAIAVHLWWVTAWRSINAQLFLAPTWQLDGTQLVPELHVVGLCWFCIVVRLLPLPGPASSDFPLKVFTSNKHLVPYTPLQCLLLGNSNCYTVLPRIIFAKLFLSILYLCPWVTLDWNFFLILSWSNFSINSILVS